MKHSLIQSEDQIQDVLDWALAGNHGLAVRGNGSKSSIGRPMAVAAELDLSGLSGVELYEPAELVMKAKAGSKLSEVKAILLQQGQQLAFDPPDYGPLLGEDADQGTLGGVFSCNLSGSSRVKAGAARDHLLGVQGYTGRGQPFVTGSRVMKNVTGYDLCKLVAGSYGTLAIATSVTFKVLPRPEKTRTVLVYDLDPATAVRAMRDGISSVHEVSAAAYLPPGIAATSDIDYAAGPGTSVLLLKIEGPGPSAEFRCEAIQSLMSSFGKVEELHGHNSEKIWNFIGNVTAFVGGDAPVWKLSLPPSMASSVLKKIMEEQPGADYFLDWAGGLAWVRLPEGLEDGGASLVRGAISENGHATLIRSSETLRHRIDPFHPLAPAITKINRRIKDGFDPQNILNPGRMYLDQEKVGSD
ncbi:MAG: FAD-binding protein [Proteobacteria bacterium]|nr:FAD-binding protein [Pseudomonadota bacterium]